MGWSTLWKETFEAGVGDWTVNEPEFAQSDVEAKVGTYSGRGNNTPGPDDERASWTRGFTRQTGKLYVDLWVLAATGPGGSQLIMLDDGAGSSIVNLRFLDGAIAYYDGEAYQDTGKTYSGSVWCHIEIECDFETNAISLLVDGASGTIEFKVEDPSGADYIRGTLHYTVGTRYFYWDEVEIKKYLGALYQANEGDSGTDVASRHDIALVAAA